LSWRATCWMGPVLLINDMADSCWMFTVIAALLRDAGCPSDHLFQNTLIA
jgi:hypothetical protein